MTDKTQDQIFDELTNVFGSHLKIESIFEDALYFNYYSEVTNYDIEKLTQFGYEIKGLVPKIDETRYPYIQIRLAF